MAIVVVGTTFVDIKGFPDNVYIPQGRNAGRVEVVHGGVGRNVVEDIANVELCPRYVSLVDKSEMGIAVVNKLNNHRVDTRYIITEPDGMGMWLAVFDETGDIVGSISKRPNQAALARLIQEKGDEIFADADSVVVEIDLDKEIVKTTIEYAHKYGKKVYAVVGNMSIAAKRRDLIQAVDCIVCNEQEAEILFVKKLNDMSPEAISEELPELLKNSGIPSMIVTLGGRGSVYANLEGEHGFCPAYEVSVCDTTGAGDAFFSGVAIGQTYGKSLAESAEIGTRLAASVIISSENVCPRFRPDEFGITL